MTIVSKVSLAVALIIESAVPDFSHFEFAKIQLIFYLCKSYLVFVCKSTTVVRNLFAQHLSYISSIVNPIWRTSYFASFLLMVDTLPANSEELSFFR